MQNRIQSKVSGISHFFLSVGILILSLLAMTGVAMVVVNKLYGVSIEGLTNLSISEATVQDTMALKVAQGIIALSFIIAGFVCAKTFRQRFGAFTNLNHGVRKTFILLGFFMFIMLLPTIDSLVSLNGSFTFSESVTKSFLELEEKSDHTYALFLKYNTGSQFWINILVMSLLAAVGEEIFFRGILMRVLTKWFGNIHVGIISSALLFTIVHFQPYKVLPMLVLGIFFGYVYYRTKSLYIPIFLHAFNNAMVVFTEWGSKNGVYLPVLSSDFEFQTIHVVVSAILFVILGIVFWKITRNHDFSYE